MKNQFWEFWIKKISHSILIKNPISSLQPISLVHFHMSSDTYGQFVTDVDDAIKNQKIEPVTSFLTNYGANTLALASVLNITDQSLSIVSQHRAVYGGDGLDFTGIMFFDIKNETWKSDISPSYYKIMSFQHYRYWLEIRKQQIISWKDDIEQLSKTLKQDVKDFSKYDPTEGFNLFAHKSSFQTEYASLVDEHRYLQRIVGNQLKEIHNQYFGERSLKTDYFVFPKDKSGFLKNMSEEILEDARHLHDEFDVIKEQYQILGDELSDLMNFVNAQQSLKLAEKNEKVQKTISRQGWITLAFTVAVLVMTYSLYDLSSNQFKIENFEPHLLYDYDNRIPIVNEVVSEERVFEADLSVTPRSNQFLDLMIENVTMRHNGYDGCYFKEEPYLRHGGSWLKQYDPKQENAKINAFVKMTYEPYEIFYSSNSTDLSKIDVGFVDYHVSIVDVQTGKRYDTSVRSQLSVEVPSQFEDHGERCDAKFSN